MPRRISAFVLLAASLICGGQSDRLGNLDQRLLDAHNRVRESVDVPPLRWDDGLAADAAIWAQHLTRIGRLVHSPDMPEDSDPEGENLWAGTRGYYSPEQMIGLWASERRNFRGGIFPAVSRTGRLRDVGHYTQMVWRSTTRVGCALARGAHDEFLVCRYAEGGNVLGEATY